MKRRSAPAMKRLAAALAVLAAASAPARAGATGFTDIGDDIRAQTATTAKIIGTLRLRGAFFYNFDLDRGPSPSGQLLFPLPLTNPSSHLLTSADLRLRNDLAFYSPGPAVAVKVRLDAPDNLALGSAPAGVPADSETQAPPVNAVRIKRVYGEVLTPVGILSAGRMGSAWGLGMLTNGGDCADCDSGDSADRIAWVIPVLGHLWAVAYDFTASGPQTAAKVDNTAIDIDPVDDVHTVTAAFLQYRDEVARERRRRAGKTTFEYGAYLSYRWQTDDVPATYLPVASPIPITSAQVMYRGYSADAFDGWLRLTLPHGRIEAEGAVLLATVAQPSLIPGVLYRQPVTAKQEGLAVESDFGDPDEPLGAGLDLGYASGDPAPGFGVNPALNAPAPVPGDINGPKADPPYKNTVDNFQFHPDYRIDRILFREIIGTVTGAVYLRPHVRYDLARLGQSKLTASLALIASSSVYASSTPGGKAPLGVELDPTLAYGSRDGFGAALEHAILFPLAGLDNPRLDLKAQPAQLLRLRLTYAY
jgi:uncharacterized protein (TIGR04551 family)